MPRLDCTIRRLEKNEPPHTNPVVICAIDNSRYQKIATCQLISDYAVTPKVTMSAKCAKCYTMHRILTEVRSGKEHRRNVGNKQPIDFRKKQEKKTAGRVLKTRKIQY
jgi:hypothetical protein